MRIEPETGQESVWDYPRPPRIESSQKQIKIIFNGVILADSYRSQRVLETSHPPVYYIPPEDIQMNYLQIVQQQSYCEWKGMAFYYDVIVNSRKKEKAAWFYPQPTPSFKVIKDYVAFYPGLMDECYLAGERVKPQPGGFYGGWITGEIVGPFKGEPGTWGW